MHGMRRLVARVRCTCGLLALPDRVAALQDAHTRVATGIHPRCCTGSSDRRENDVTVMVSR